MSRPRSATAVSVHEPLVQPWVPVVSLVLAALGLAVSGYLTYEHFTASTTLACPDTGTWNCVTVTTSAQSKLFGIPVALLGLLAYVAVLAFVVWDSELARTLAAAIALSAVGFAVYLITLQAFVIDAWCVWCLVNDLVIVPLLAVLTVWRVRRTPA